MMWRSCDPSGCLYSHSQSFRICWRWWTIRNSRQFAYGRGWWARLILNTLRFDDVVRFRSDRRSYLSCYHGEGNAQEGILQTNRLLTSILAMHAYFRFVGFWCYHLPTARPTYEPIWSVKHRSLHFSYDSHLNSFMHMLCVDYCDNRRSSLTLLPVEELQRTRKGKEDSMRQVYKNPVVASHTGMHCSSGVEGLLTHWRWWGFTNLSRERIEKHGEMLWGLCRDIPFYDADIWLLKEERKSYPCLRLQLSC